MEDRTYRCIARSEAGFVQQLAVSYIRFGYLHYVTGAIPQRKDPALTDRTLIEKYAIDISKWSRARRKRNGLANVHYLRFERFFVLIATRGEHPFFQAEAGIRDVRRDSISFNGYSIGYKQDVRGVFHPSVRIHPNSYRDLKGYFEELSIKASAEQLSRELSRVRFEPYAPVRSQMMNILRSVNFLRAQAALEILPSSVLRLRRRPTTVFVRPAEDLS